MDRPGHDPIRSLFSEDVGLWRVSFTVDVREWQWDFVRIWKWDHGGIGSVQRCFEDFLHQKSVGQLCDAQHQYVGDWILCWWFFEFNRTFSSTGCFRCSALEVSV